jgi:T5SS/PEP-CTERM-associated repeat protein
MQLARLRRPLCGGAAIVVSCLCGTAHAADTASAWNGSSGVWSNGTAWSTSPSFPANEFDATGTVVAKGFDATVNSGTVTFDLPGVAVQQLSVGGSGSLTNAAGELQALKGLFVAGSAQYAQDAGGSGLASGVTVTGGAVNVNGGVMTVDGSYPVPGTVLVAGMQVGLTPNLPVTVSLSGGGDLTLGNPAGALVLGALGNAQFKSSGTAVVDGAGTTLTSLGNTAFGFQGTGAVVVKNGGLLDTRGVTLGREATGVGTVDVRDANTLWSDSGTAGLAIGYSGQGTLSLSAGARRTGVSGTVIGRFAGAVGNLTVDGIGTSFTDQAGMTIGGLSAAAAAAAGISDTADGGTGRVVVTGGATVAVGAVEMGGDPSGVGTLSISGAASQFAVATDMLVGGYPASPLGPAGLGGRGSITVSNGGALRVTNNLLLYPSPLNILTLAGGTVNAGTLTVGGALIPNGGGAVARATLTGNGAITGNVANGGTVAPGASAGSLTVVGAFAQGPTGLLVMEIGGTTPVTGYDKLTAAAINFGGVLDVNLLGGFVPAAGNTFDLLDFSVAQGQFDQILLDPLPIGLSWNTSLLYTAGVISVVPEPSCGIPIITLLAGVRLRARKRRSLK